MKKWMKRIVVAVAALIALAAAGLVAGMPLAERTMQRKIEVKVAAAQPRSDAQALVQGRYLYVSRGCVDSMVSMVRGGPSSRTAACASLARISRRHPAALWPDTPARTGCARSGTA